MEYVRFAKRLHVTQKKRGTSRFLWEPALIVLINVDASVRLVCARSLSSFSKKVVVLEGKMAKILIVDDSLIMRGILRSMLEKGGHQIAGAASNGKDALRLYGELNPDLVTMDIHMAGGDGLTCLKEIIQLDPDAKVVMITALGHEEMKTEASRLGAVGYLCKPFKVEDILAEIQDALSP